MSTSERDRDTAPEAATDAGGGPGAAVVELPLLAAPADGLPPLTDSPEALSAAADALAQGWGPVAVDAERASGYRYGQDAMLVQLRRAGAGTVLIDPVALPDLGVVQQALGSAEWVLHAASQDLPCLAGVGLRPGGKLFDTELGGRLAGYERVGLGAVVERLLGVRLAKEHSAVDWSTRPLPEPWLLYAALDVELLVDLRDALASDLADQGKLEWARQEFAAVRDAPPAPPRTDPWRRVSGLHAIRQRRQLAAVRELWLSRDELARKRDTAPGRILPDRAVRDAPPAPPRTDPWRRVSGLHAVRDRRQLAAVRELWSSRDELARRRDTAPGRILPDRAVVAAAQAMPTTARELAALPVFSGPANRRLAPRWLEALDRARALPADQLPPHSLPSDGPPPPRAWKDRDPEAAERLTRARAALTALAEELRLPVENLLSPDTVRRLCWEPPADASADGVRAALAAAGARPWQRELTGPLLAEALSS